MRTIRISQEIANNQIKFIHTNDFDPKVIEIIKENINYNIKDEDQRNKISLFCHDTEEYLREKSNFAKYDFIDIDPYGSPSLMIDPSLNAISEGGIIGITATDTMDLCGLFPSTCFITYNAVPLRSKHCHQMALRILLGNIAHKASLRKKVIIPLLSFSFGHFFRLFVQVYHDPLEASLFPSKMGNVLKCTDCNTIRVDPLFSIVKSSNNENIEKLHPKSYEHSPNCGFCGGSIKLYGPVWIDNIHHADFSNNLLRIMESKDPIFNNNKNLNGLLNVISNELSIPFAYDIYTYFAKIKFTPAPMVCLYFCCLNY